MSAESLLSLTEPRRDWRPLRRHECVDLADPNDVPATLRRWLARVTIATPYGADDFADTWDCDERFAWFTYTSNGFRLTIRCTAAAVLEVVEALRAQKT